MHDLTDTVIAVIEDHEVGQVAVTALGVEGLRAELLLGEEGRAHLSGDESEGLSAVVNKLALAFGDEVRILDLLDRALERGAAVVSVAVSADQAPRAATILEEHGGREMWRLGEWSFNRVGSAEVEEG